MPNPTLSLKQAAVQLGVNVDLIYDIVRSGDLVAFQLRDRGRWLVRQSALEEYILSREEIARQAATIRNAPLSPKIREYTRQSSRSDPPPRPYVRGERWV